MPITRRLVPFALAALALVGCSDSSADDEIESNTPRITTDGSAASDPGLLTTEAVEAALGTSPVTAVDLDEVPVFENPDPRGPCGAVVEALDFSGATGRAFTAPELSMVELLLPADEARRNTLAQYQADQQDGCPPFDSVTNQGATQTISDVRFVEVPGAGTDAIVWTSTVAVGGSSAAALLALVVVGDDVVLIQGFGLEPVTDAVAVALVEAAVAAAS